MNKCHSPIGWHNDTTPALNETNLNYMDGCIDTIDDRVVAMDSSKLESEDVEDVIVNVTMDDDTGIFTFTKYDGTTFTIDTKLEKIAVNFRYDTATQKLIITLDDGTTQEIDLSSLIQETDFADSSTIVWTVTNHVASASIKGNSIGDAQMQTGYLTDCQSAASTASTAATNANTSKLQSEGFAVGEQNGVPVGSTSPYYHNNAKYYAQQAGGTSLVGLSDVSITSPSDGQALVYDADEEKWKNGEVSAVGELNDLSDVTIGDIYQVSEGQVLRYYAIDHKWVNAPIELDSLDNVAITVPIDGQGLVYDADTQKWVNGDVSSAMHSILTVQTISPMLYGKTVTATRGDYSVSGVMSNLGKCELKLAKTGTYTITCDASEPATVAVPYFGSYTVDLLRWHLWGVQIDQANSNPETACTYTDDAVGMTPGSDAWDTLFRYRPCLLVNGVVSKYLNPNDYTKDIDGNAVDITTLGNDVMVEFPKMGYKITTSGDTTLVQVTDEPNADGFCYKPFSRNAIGDRDYFYYGAYKSYSSGNRMYSSSGKTPTGNKTRATFRSEATSRGTGYFQNGFYQLIFLQCLYLLKYKDRNSQTALGYGYVSGSATQQTGETNTKGLNYGNTSSQTDRVKLFGIEDMWGNIWQWVDGLSTDGSRKYVVTHLPVNFDDATSGTAHTTYDSGITADLGNYISRVQGTTDCGFAAKATSGSETTYWADYTVVAASRVAMFGGDWYYGAREGVFRLAANNASSYSYAGIASRLMYV